MKSLIIALILPLSLLAEAPFGDSIRELVFLNEKNTDPATVVIYWSPKTPRSAHVELEKKDGVEFGTDLLIREVGLHDPNNPFAPPKRSVWVSIITVRQGDFERVRIRLSDGRFASLADLIKAYPTKNN